MFDSLDGLDAYQNTSVHAKAAGADLHQLVLMLFNGFMDELERTEGHIKGKRFDKKALGIEKMLKILGGLEASLDPNNREEVVINMKQLYQYCGQALLNASLNDDLNDIASVRAIMTSLQEGWEQLASQAA